MTAPENRGLTPEEATLLLAASEMAFPVPPNLGEQTDPESIRKMREEDPSSRAILLPAPIEGAPARYADPPNGHSLM